MTAYVSKNVEALTLIAGRSTSWFSPMEISIEVPKKAEIDVSQHPAIPVLGIHLKDATSYFRDNCSSMFITALFIIATN